VLGLWAGHPCITVCEPFLVSSSLQIASSAGHVEIVRHLLNLDATPDVRDSENHTPLHLACGVEGAQPGHLEIITMLLEKGVLSEEKS
jgi:ankyrin repeat protein